MLELKFIREHPEKIRESLKNRGYLLDLDPLLKLDKERRALLLEYETLRSQQK